MAENNEQKKDVEGFMLYAFVSLVCFIYLLSGINRVA